MNIHMIQEMTFLLVLNIVKRSVFVENIEEICIWERSEDNEEICLPDLNRIVFVERLVSFPKHLGIFLSI